VALTQTLTQMTASVRKYTNAQGATALLRHPNADVYDYINRGLSRLRFLLTQANPDQRYLASSTLTTEDGVSVYSLPADFGSLISIDLTIDSRKHWLLAYEMHERPALTSEDEAFQGKPFCYRLRGANIEVLPEPQAEYTGTLWYVPTQTELSAGADTFDTVNRLDDFIVAWAGKLSGTKDKNWDLVQECRATLGELVQEIEVLGRTRDQNSPPRIVDVYQADRWGRRRRH
jgi:hypothetical protein